MGCAEARAACARALSPPRHRPLLAAKEAGIIGAVLAGFSHFSQNATVYRNFREVISALRIEEEEVLEAIENVRRVAKGVPATHHPLSLACCL